MPTENLTEVEFKLAAAVEVGEEAVRRLDTWIVERKGEVKFRAKCGDSAVRTFRQASDLLMFGNESFRRIEKMVVTFSMLPAPSCVELGIGSRNHDGGFGNVEVKLRGNEPFCEEAKTYFRQEVSRWKAWYSLLTYIPWGIVIGFYMSVLGLTWLTVWFPPSGISGGFATLLLVLLIMFSVAAGIGACILCRRIFPRVHFSIGDGVQRAEVANRFRWLFIGTVPLVAVTLLHYSIGKLV